MKARVCYSLLLVSLTCIPLHCDVLDLIETAKSHKMECTTHILFLPSAANVHQKENYMVFNKYKVFLLLFFKCVTAAFFSFWV